MERVQKCPICRTVVTSSERYSQYVCGSCAVRAQDEAGRPLTFSNVSFSGGFAALYRDTHEERTDHICYVDGIKCWADESYFGGIVIEPYGDEDQ